VGQGRVSHTVGRVCAWSREPHVSRACDAAVAVEVLVMACASGQGRDHGGCALAPIALARSALCLEAPCAQHTL